MSIIWLQGIRLVLGLWIKIKTVVCIYKYTDVTIIVCRVKQWSCCSWIVNIKTYVIKRWWFLYLFLLRLSRRCFTVCKRTCVKLALWRYQIGLGPMPIFCASFATHILEFATPYLSRNHVHTDGEPTSHSLPIFSDWLQTNTNILKFISNYLLPGFQNLEPNSLAPITFLVMAGARVDR